MTWAFPKPVRVRKPPKRLARSGPPRRKRKGGPRRSERRYDEAFIRFVWTLPCVIAGERGHRCWYPLGRSEADHQGKRPRGRKADDVTAVPMCTRAHEERSSLSGYFRSFTKERMRAWTEERIAETQARYFAAGSRRTGG